MDLSEKSEQPVNPRYKNEIRQAIYCQVSNIKQTAALREMLQLADMLRRMSNKVEYKTLSDIERAQCNITEYILHCNDEKAMGIIKTFVRSCLNPIRQQGQQKGREL